jgi:hypothetical protein
LLLAACGEKPADEAGAPETGGAGAGGSGGLAGSAAAGGRANVGGSGLGGAAAGATSGLGGTSSNGAAGGSSGSGTVAAGGSSAGAAAAGRAGSDDSGGRNAAGGVGIGAGAGGRGSGGAPSAGAGGLPGGGAAGSGGAPSASDATFVPDTTWACGRPDGIPPPAKGKLLFSASIPLNDLHDVGTTQFGHRRVLDLGAGTVSGDRLQGTLTNGAIDFELTLSNDVAEFEEVGVIKAKDGTLIFVRGCGVGAPGEPTGRVVLDFEVASSSSLSWLNTGKYVATRVLDESGGKLELSAYDVSDVAAGEPKLALGVPAGVPHQPWDCSTTTGGKGASVFTEQVGIGSSLSVGASKNGTRNVIPITGGTVSGKLTGTVVAGGADYQLLGSSTHLDARYSLASNDGEYVVVRNCGNIGALVPTFEARADGPYAFLNANTFLSSDPGGGGGGVTITFYERK